MGLRQQEVIVCPSTKGKGVTIQLLCSKIKGLHLEKDVILCLGSAAGWLGMSNALIRGKLEVYTNIPKQNLPTFLEPIDIDFSNKKTMRHKGIRCTTYKQTMFDMLEYTDSHGNQDLYEALQRYYFHYANESFDALKSVLNEKQLQTLNMYEKPSIEYGFY